MTSLEESEMLAEGNNQISYNNSHLNEEEKNGVVPPFLMKIGWS